MKVIVLTAGRSGSLALYKACTHIRNFTAGHDSKSGLLAADRAMVADGHIEIDTRFAWFLGRLGQADKGDVHYVHLTRDVTAVAQSYNSRWGNRKGIIRGYCEAVLQREKPKHDMALAVDLVETVEANITTFLAGRPHSVIRLESLKSDVPAFFAAIGAEVDLPAAMAEFEHRHNRTRKQSLFMRARYRLSRSVDAIERGLIQLRRGR